MRARFTIPSAAWGRARAYAEATNRTPSELICEALDQIQKRYPRGFHTAETDLDILAAKVAEKLKGMSI